MKKARLLSLLLVAALLCCLLASCSSSTSSSQESNASSTETNSSTSNSTDPVDVEDNSDSDSDSEEPLENITFWFYDLYEHGDNGQKIEDAVNEITEDLLNIHVDIEWFNAGSYTTQLGISIAGGTTIDLISIMPAPPTSVATLHSSNQLTEISSLLQEYAPETYAMMEPYLSAYTYEDGLFGVPARKNWATNRYIMMREDVLQELGLYDFAANMTTWSEYEEILQKVTDTYSSESLYGLGRARGNSVTVGTGFWPMAGEAFSDYVAYDSLGDSLGLITTDSEGTVGNYWADARTEAELKLLADWYSRGYIWPDSAFSDTDGDDLVSSRTIFSKIEGGEIGIETRQRANCGTEMLCVQICDGYISTSTVTSWGLAIPSTAEEPEAACRFIEQLYTNADLLNILLLGIEGEDYVLLDTGEADYPEGLEQNTVEYHEADWMFGNQSLVHPWAGDGADYRALAEAANAACDVSPYLGFSANTSELETLTAALTAVQDQYAATMRCGLYTSEEYQAFLSKLDTAGLADYIAAYQEQLDAWLASK